MKMLKKATNKMAYAKVGIYGETGSGKTFTAALVAIGLYKFANLKKPVGMFDTEPAASYIIPLFEKAGIEFVVYDESRALKDLMSVMDEFESECDIAIIDSITHVWRDTQDSYIKKINQTRAQNRKKPIYQLEFHHWRPIKSAWHTFTDRFLSSKLHCIVCGRMGAIYQYQKDEEKGKMELVTIGNRMATEKEMGYEPSLLIEMVKHRENGRIINRALIEKDRSDLINGDEIDRPDFDKLKAHFDTLNINGEHATIKTDRDSTDMFTEEGEDNWSYEKRQRDIWCEEIQGLLLKYYPSTGKEDKTAKADLIEEVFKTRSWTKIQSMQHIEIKNGYLHMKELLTTYDPESIPTDSKPLIINPTPPEDDVQDKHELPLRREDTLKAFATQKARVGEKAYYDSLGAMSLKHANEIKNRAGFIIIFDELKRLPTEPKMQSETKSEPILYPTLLGFKELKSKMEQIDNLPHLQNFWKKYQADIKALSEDERSLLTKEKEDMKKVITQIMKSKKASAETEMARSASNKLDEAFGKED